MRHQYFQIEAIEKLDQFIKECESTLDKFDPTDEAKRTINSATLRENITLIKGLAEGDVPETDYKHLTLISWIKRWDAVEKTGMYDLLENSLPLQSLPLGKKNTLPFRIDGLRKSARSKPVPVVIALHGAGGSENLFFEGYGDGYAVKACQKRGWIIVSPRGGLNFNSGPPVKKLIDAVAKKYPVDMKRIFFVGNSMGGAQAVALCQEHPGLFAAAAVLGGGGTVKDAKPFASLPMHIGYGSQDIGRGGAKALNKALVAGGAKNVTLKEYLDLDHLVIVREALPDVFALFDRVSDDIQKAK